MRAQSLLDALQRAGVDSVDRRVAQGILRRLQGRLDDAIKELELAVALGRNDLSGNFELAATLVLAGRPQDAIPRLQAALRLNPAGTFAALQHRELGRAQALLGRADEAIAALKRARALDDDSWSAAVDLAAAFGMRGDIDDGKAALAAATAALAALAVWMLFAFFWNMIVQLVAPVIFAPDPFDAASILRTISALQTSLRLSPNTLFVETAQALLSPETRTLALEVQLTGLPSGSIPRAPLPFDQSLVLIWPQLTGLLAGFIALFTVGYIVFQRQEVRA